MRARFLSWVRQRKKTYTNEFVRFLFLICHMCFIMLQEEIVHKMEVVCYLFPASVKDQCKDFIDVYGQALINMLLEATNPEAVCVMLKCCAANKPPPPPGW